MPWTTPAGQKATIGAVGSTAMFGRDALPRATDREGSACLAPSHLKWCHGLRRLWRLCKDTAELHGVLDPPLHPPEIRDLAAVLIDLPDKLLVHTGECELPAKRTRHRHAFERGIIDALEIGERGGTGGVGVGEQLRSVRGPERRDLLRGEAKAQVQRGSWGR